MKYRVYEYPIKTKDLEYTGSYTVKADCPNEKPLAKKLKAKMVEEFEA